MIEGIMLDLGKLQEYIEAIAGEIPSRGSCLRPVFRERCDAENVLFQKENFLQNLRLRHDFFIPDLLFQFHVL